MQLFGFDVTEKTSPTNWLKIGIPAAAILLAGVVVYFWFATQNDTTATLPDPIEAVADVDVGTKAPAAPLSVEAPEIAESTVPNVEITDAPEVPVVPQIAPPTFDVVRIEPDGTALIAGSASHLGRVSVLLDGQVVGESDVDSSGKFVVFAFIKPKIAPRSLQLALAPKTSDETVLSDDTVLVAAMAPQPAPIEIQAPEISDSPTLDVAETSAPEAVEDVTSPTVLLANEDGVKVLDPGGSGPPLAVVSLDSIAYDTLGEVELGGRATGEGFVRVYIDNSIVSTVPVDDSGFWTSDLPNVDKGIYVLRVDEVDLVGDVVSRVETPFKREDPEELKEFTTQSSAPEPKVVEPSQPLAEPEIVAQTEVAAPAAVEQDQSPVATLAEEGAVSAPEIAKIEEPSTLAVFSVQTVQPGATLWAIAEKKYGSGTFYLKVFEANKDRIRDPDLIYPGQVFAVP